jgi:hypothetical protein
VPKKYSGSVPTSGSGWVAVVPFDSGGQCGHFGAKIIKIRVQPSEIGNDAGWQWMGGSKMK